MVGLSIAAEQAAAGTVRELDASVLKGQGSKAPGAVSEWFEKFMEVADHLEGLKDPEESLRLALSAVLATTGADRVFVELEPGHEVAGRREWFQARDERAGPFQVSRSLVDLVKSSKGIVHVPMASADPTVSSLQSVRREGISSTFAMPLRALGKTVGILYADCVREDVALSAIDFQHAAMLGRLLATSLGNREMVLNFVRRDEGPPASEPEVLRSKSPICRDMGERIRLYAPTDYTVLIRGETGVGKELMARAIHALSRRSRGAFIPVNCAAIPEQLMESELFGHEKGAFTGAVAQRKGQFEAAEGGTLLLDEIGDMPHELQSKILRVLQDRQITPVGSRRQIRVDVRILAATHQPLEKMVEDGKFREDLYYRLRELEVLIPPLRERREDLHELVARFASEAAQELGLAQVPEFGPEAMDLILAAPWKGNVRELRHAVKSAILRAKGGNVRTEHLDDALRAATSPVARIPGVSFTASGLTWRERLEKQEIEALRTTLEQAAGNLTKGAELFGVPRTTYREKLVKYGLLAGPGGAPAAP
jgi:transcriptional regulator with GAF, ATPase, and Fis domain